MVVVPAAGASAGVGEVSQTPAGTVPTIGAGRGLPNMVLACQILGVAGGILDPGTVHRCCRTPISSK